MIANDCCLCCIYVTCIKTNDTRKTNSTSEVWTIFKPPFNEGGKGWFVGFFLLWREIDFSFKQDSFCLLGNHCHCKHSFFQVIICSMLRSGSQPWFATWIILAAFFYFQQWGEGLLGLGSKNAHKIMREIKFSTSPSGTGGCILKIHSLCGTRWCTWMNEFW